MEERTCIHVALLAETGGAAAWSGDLAAALRAADGVQLTGVLLQAGPGPRTTASQRVHAGLERALFGLLHPLLEIVAPDVAFSGIPVLRDLAGVDVLISLVADRPCWPLLGGFSGQVWAFGPASHRTSTGPGGFSPGAGPAVTALFLLAPDPAMDCVLEPVVTATHRRSVHHSVAVAVAWWPAIAVRRLQARRLGLELPPTAESPRLRRFHGAGALEAGRVSLGVTARFVRDRLRRRRVREQWQLGFQLGGGELDLSRLVRVNPPPDRFWADPFPCRRGDGWVVFFEEQLDGAPHGHISALAVRPDGTWESLGTVLERPHHLSYPFLLEWEGAIFMIPEAGATGRVQAYRCTRFPDRWEEDAVLLDGPGLYDTTLVETGGRWWMFTTAGGGGAAVDSLLLFHAEAPFGPWMSHPLNPIKVDARSARCGGGIRGAGGALLRPAQDCSERYGRSLTWQRIEVLSPVAYRERTVGSVVPGWDPDVVAVHTVNACEGLVVVDFIAVRPTG
ncbi:MAG: hypothetical protein ABIK09_06610 [Pseudomonadota bacterium]